MPMNHDGKSRVSNKIYNGFLLLQSQELVATLGKKLKNIDQTNKTWFIGQRFVGLTKND